MDFPNPMSALLVIPLITMVRLANQYPRIIVERCQQNVVPVENVILATTLKVLIAGLFPRRLSRPYQRLKNPPHPLLKNPPQPLLKKPPHSLQAVTQ